METSAPTTKTIFLLPYGGGSASSFRSYVRRFSPATARVIPVELPGRGARSHEDSATSIEQCAALALEQVDTAGEDYIFHGHCMGALLAFEAIKLIEAAGRRLPRFLVVSGRNAPQHVNDWLKRVATLDDRGLFAKLQELGGVPARLSFAMAQPFLSAIRGDQAMFIDYRPGPTTIDVPVLVLAGLGDRMTTPDALADWQHYTTRRLSIEWLEGEHYFILDQPERVSALIDAFWRALDGAA